jgi:hypothetical protein
MGDSEISETVRAAQAFLRSKSIDEVNRTDWSKISERFKLRPELAKMFLEYRKSIEPVHSSEILDDDESSNEEESSDEKRQNAGLVRHWLMAFEINENDGLEAVRKLFCSINFDFNAKPLARMKMTAEQR